MSDSADAVAIYDSVGNDPGIWVLKAQALFESARILKDCQCTHASSSSDIAEVLFRMDMQQVFVMLRGMGTECLLKAVWAKCAKPLASAGFFRKPTSRNPHDLVILEHSLGQYVATGLSVKERVVLARMTKQITAGRYPIEMKVGQVSSVPSGAPVKKLMHWSVSDEEMFHSLVEKLLKLI